MEQGFFKKDLMSGKSRLALWAYVHGYVMLYRAGRVALSEKEFRKLLHIARQGDLFMDSRPDNAFAAAPCLAISAALCFLGTGLRRATLAACLARPHSSACGRFASLCQAGVFWSPRLPMRLVP